VKVHNSKRERVEARKQKFISLEEWCKQKFGTHHQSSTVGQRESREPRTENREPRVKK
jgi:hypothetical protein